MKHNRLSRLRPGQIARIDFVPATSPIFQRLLDLGLVRHTKIEGVQTAPGGDPSAYLIRGTVIALRREDAHQIQILMEEQGGHYGTDQSIHRQLRRKTSASD